MHSSPVFRPELAQFRRRREAVQRRLLRNLDLGATHLGQFRRIEKGLKHAAKTNQIFHLWWHPHNFGVKTDENLQLLRRIFERFRELRGEHGMRSLSMADTARQAAELSQAATI